MSRTPKDHLPLDFTFEEVVQEVADQNKPAKTSFTSRPFIKWVGGKRSIIPELTSRMPDAFTKYYEPFIGGGALYFSLKPQTAHLSDINFHLVVTYNAVKSNVEALIGLLKNHALKHSPAYFLKARKKLFVEILMH